jgi:hypothetical protein
MQCVDAHQPRSRGESLLVHRLGAPLERVARRLQRLLERGALGALRLQLALERIVRRAQRLVLLDQAQHLFTAGDGGRGARERCRDSELTLGGTHELAQRAERSIWRHPVGLHLRRQRPLVLCRGPAEVDDVDAAARTRRELPRLSGPGTWRRTVRREAVESAHGRHATLTAVCCCLLLPAVYAEL